VEKPHSVAAENEPRAKASASPGETKWKTIEELAFTWMPGQQPVRFKLEIPEGYKDAGDFTRIRISVAGQREFVADNPDGWIEYDSKEQPSEVYAQLKERNLVQSKYVLILASSARKDEAPLIFLRSWAYASDAERLHVIGFQPSGQPITLLNAELNLEKFEDLDGDGSAEIIGRPCMSEETAPGFLTYNPYQIYKVPHRTIGPAVLSNHLSREYNLKHYYGWAGPNCTDQMTMVLHPPNGSKPAIMPTAEAEKLMHARRDR
jgi:hypothetical protein